MKMSRQNPGGEVVTRPTMKGCELGMNKGKGSDVGGTLVTKYSTNAPGMEGAKKMGHLSPGKAGKHANESMVTSIVTGTSKACRQ